MNQLDNFTQDELRIGKGVATVDNLPFEAPWLSPFGACLINITDVRHNESMALLSFNLVMRMLCPMKQKTEKLG